MVHPNFFPEYVKGYESFKHKCHRDNDNILTNLMLLRMLVIKTLRTTYELPYNISFQNLCQCRPLIMLQNLM